MDDHERRFRTFFDELRPAFGREINHTFAAALTDAKTHEAVQSETRQPVAWLSAARLSFLRRASAIGRRPVLVSDGLTAITEPLRQALRFHRGGWAVRGGDGVLRNGLTGRRLPKVAAAVDLKPVDDPDDLALAYLRPLRADQAQLSISVTLRHPPGPVPLPGESVEILLGSLTGTEPAAFGRSEPALQAWDAAELGWIADQEQSRGLARSMFTVVGPEQAPASLVLAIQRWSTHTEEQLNGLISLGPLDAPGLSHRLSTVDQALSALSRACDVTFALASTRPGNRQLTQPPIMASALVPLAIILGNGLVTGLRVDVSAAVRQFPGATARRGSGLIVPLETSLDSSARLPQLLDQVHFRRAAPHMGISPHQVQAVLNAARF